MIRPFAVFPVFLLSVCAPAQLIWEKTLAPGLVYRQEVDRVAPRVVHALRVSPGSPALKLAAEPTGGAVNEVASAPTGRTTVGQTVSKEAASVASEGALAAVNGDFFADLSRAWTGHSLGLMVRAGEIVATPNPRRAVFAWGPETLAFGKAEWQGTIRIEGGIGLRLNGLNRTAGGGEAILNLPVGGAGPGPGGGRLGHASDRRAAVADGNRVGDGGAGFGRRAEHGRGGGEGGLGGSGSEGGGGAERAGREPGLGRDEDHGV